MSDDEITLNVNLNDTTPASPDPSSSKESGSGGSRFYRRYPHLAPEDRRNDHPPIPPVETPPSRFYTRYPHLNPNAQPPEPPVPPTPPTPPLPPGNASDLPPLDASNSRRIGSQPKNRSGYVSAADYLTQHGRLPGPDGHSNDPVSDPTPTPSQARKALAGRRRRRRNRWRGHTRKASQGAGGLLGRSGGNPGGLAGGLLGRFGGTGAGMVGGIVGGVTGSPTLGAAGGAVAAGIGSGLLALGPVGIAVGVGLTALTVSVSAVTEVFQHLRNAAKELAERLKEVNGPLAVAFAERQVKFIQQDVNIGQNMGQQLAAQTRAETELALALRQLNANVLKPLLPLITDLTIAMGNISRAAGIVIPSAIESNPLFLQIKLAHIFAKALVEVLKGEIPSLAQLWQWWWNAPNVDESKSFFEDQGMAVFLNPNNTTTMPNFKRPKRAF